MVLTRKPCMDTFDYEVDSDDEWEEEEPGESLHGSDDEKDKEEDAEDDYEVDNEFFVPHGYLSDEEINADEEEEDEDFENPEKQEAKLKVLGEQFEAERKEKAVKNLKPKVIGCIWLNANGECPENTRPLHVQFLKTHQAWTRERPIVLTPPAESGNSNEACTTPSNKHASARKAKAFEEAMPDLIRLLHGNRHSRVFLVKEFIEFWTKKKEMEEKLIPKARLHAKISEIATWGNCQEAGPLKDKLCWFVSEEIRNKYFPEEKLSLPNRWQYLLTPKKKNLDLEEVENNEDKEKEKENESEKKREPEKKGICLITKFTKTMTTEEKQKELTEKPVTSELLIKKPGATATPSIKPGATKAPKRATLISVPLGRPLPPKVPKISSSNEGAPKKDPPKEKRNDADKDDGCVPVSTNEIDTNAESDENSVSLGSADSESLTSEENSAINEEEPGIISIDD
ncbi:hypothetical protein TKK_0009727 [Trichogramma kaykai]|uniref:Chromatin assembly factor 1 subunit A dimerization domain-containing protein n=1 Tax=Trichogramma kaykai TaxID=54128 RepID=A0ABD2X061_9HYME